MLENDRFEVLDITTRPTSEYVGLTFREMPIRGALIGAMLERLRPLEESLEYDLDHASLIRVHAARLGEGAPRPDRAAHRLDPRCSAREPGLDRGAGDERLREVPPGARAQPRPQAALRRVLRVGRTLRTCCSSTTSSRSWRRRRSPRSSARSVRCSRSSSREAPRGRRELLRPVASTRPPEGVRRADPRDARVRPRLVPARPDGPPVLHLLLPARRPHDDPLQPDGPRLHLVDDARGGPRPYEHGMPVARSDAARRVAVARPATSRRPPRGRISSAAASRSGCTCTSRSRRPSPASSATSTSTTSCRRQRRRARAHPRRGRRGDLQPAHHPALRARAAADRGPLAPKDLPEAWNAGMADCSASTCPTTRTACSRTSTGAGRHRLLPDVRPRQRHLAADLGGGPRCASRPRCPDGGRRSARALDLARDNLYSLGRKFTPKETIERLTGSPTIDPQPYLAYLRDKLAALPAGA